MRALILAIIILLPSYVIRFHIGPFPATLLEVLLLILFLCWTYKRTRTFLLKRTAPALPRPTVAEVSMEDTASAGMGNRWAEDALAGATSARHDSLDASRARREGAPIPSTPFFPDTGACRRGSAGWRSLLIPTLLFVVAGTVSVFVAPDLRAAAGLWRAYIVEPILFFVIFLDVARGWKTVFHDVILALGISALLVSTIAIYQQFVPAGLTLWGNTFFVIPNAFWSAEATRRVTSIFGFPNAIGLYLAPITVLVIGWVTTHRPHPRPPLQGEGGSVLLLFTALTSILAMYFAKSEGALIATAAGLAFFGLTFAPLRRWTVGILALAFVLILLIPSTRTYATNTLTFNFDSGPIRLLQWKDTIRMLADRPIFGAGLSGYPTRFAPYHSASSYIEVYQYPHNVILNFWSEMGLLGVIAFGWIVTWCYCSSLRDLKGRGNLGGRFAPLAMTLTVLSTLTAILIHGAVDVPYFKNDLSIFFWLLVALLIVTTSETSHENA